MHAIGGPRVTGAAQAVGPFLLGRVLADLCNLAELRETCTSSATTLPSRSSQCKSGMEGVVFGQGLMGLTRSDHWSIIHQGCDSFHPETVVGHMAWKHPM